MRNGTATLVAGNDSRPAIPHSRALSEPNAPIHRLEGESPPPAPDRPVQAAGPEASRDHEWEIGLDVAVDGRGADFGRQAGRKMEGDRAVDGAELEGVAPRGAAEGRLDRAEIGRASCRERV